MGQRLPMDEGVGKAERNGKIREAVERFHYSQQEVAQHRPAHHDDQPVLKKR